MTNEAKDKPKGGSNQGKYRSGPYCGPAGGAPAKTYPVNTRKRAIAALSYARNAPNPGGIRKCVCRNWPDLPACKKKDGEWGIDMMSCIDELRAMCKDGMLSEQSIITEIYDIYRIFNLSKAELASAVGYVFNTSIDRAIDYIATLG